MENNNDWNNIHEDFGKNPYLSYDKTYQQYWEELNLTYQDAQILISAGFEPDDYWTVEQWKNQGFDCDQTEKWINVGLNKKDSEKNGDLTQ